MIIFPSIYIVFKSIWASIIRAVTKIKSFKKFGLNCLHIDNVAMKIEKSTKNLILEKGWIFFSFFKELELKFFLSKCCKKDLIHLSMNQDKPNPTIIPTIKYFAVSNI